MEENSGKELPYTPREIREKWHDIANDLQTIIAQTTKTNGSVADINRWRERMNGAGLVAGFFMTVIVIPVLTWSIYVLININNTIETSVQKALSTYEVQVK